MNRIRVVILALSLFCIYTIQSCASKEYDKHTEKRVTNIQEQIKHIYPRILKSVVSMGAGSSGVIVSEDGHILTASHVVGSLLFYSDTIIVKLSDGSEEEAVHLGRTSSGDYAMLKIKKDKKWPFVKLGSNSELASSEMCLMLSHPEGFQEGRSAVLRMGFVRGHTKSGFLRTTCKMMPGDSGGPLFNLKGDLIGINSSCDAKMYENYFASVDSIRANWDRMKNGEEFGMNAMPWGDQSIKKAAEKDGPFVLPGDYYDVNKVLNENYSMSADYVFPIYSREDDDKVLIHATCINKEGILVSKSSLLIENTLRCRLSDGRFENLKVVGRSEENDLVFLAFENNQLKFDLPEYGEVEVGDFIGGFNNDKLLTSGIVSCYARKVSIQKTGSFEIGMEGLSVTKVKTGFMNAGTKFKEGDKIISINSKKMKQKSDLDEFMSNTCVNQHVYVRLERDNKELGFDIELGPMIMNGHPAYDLEVSGRREGFPNAFTSDIPLKPVECGTPLVNLNGKIVGISIARSTRTCTYAIPISDVVSAYKSLQ